MRNRQRDLFGQDGFDPAGRVFEVHIMEMWERSPSESRRHLDMIHIEDDEEGSLEQYSERTGLNFWGLETTLVKAAQKFGRRPFATILFEKEYRLGGHISQVRSSPDKCLFSSNRLKPGHSVAEDGVPGVTLIVIRDKAEFEKLASQSLLFKPARNLLSDRPYKACWLVLSPEPDAHWLSQTEPGDDALFLRNMREQPSSHGSFDRNRRRSPSSTGNGRDLLIRGPSRLTQSELALWDEIAAKAPAPDPQSCGPAWQITSLACSHHAGAPIIARQSGDSQIAFALTSGVRGPCLGPLEARWKFGCPVMGPDAIEMLADVVEELRAEIQTEAITVTIPGLDPLGRHAEQIDAKFRDVRTHVQGQHASSSLSGGIDGWLSRRSINFRRNLMRAQRRASMAGIWFERIVPSSQIEADSCYDRMLDVERQSWKGPIRQGLLALPVFYRKLIRAYVDFNAARVVIAKHGSEDVGFCFGGLSHGIYRGQQTSYSDQLSSFSIGMLMHFETAKWLAEERASLQHFGPVERMMQYKSSFCELQPSSVQKAFSI